MKNRFFASSELFSNSRARAISASAPTYDNTIASSEFSDLATLIDTEEDSELAAAKVQEINTLMQNELNEFNQENIEFQATIQKETQEDTLATDDFWNRSYKANKDFYMENSYIENTKYNTE